MPTERSGHNSETEEGFATTLHEAAASGNLRMVRKLLTSDLEARALLGYLRGRSYRHLSRDLDCKVKQVDNALQRAKQKLNAHFA